MVQSSPPNTADLGTDEKAAVFGNRRYWESYITYKTLIWDLEMSGGIGGGGAVLEGTTVADYLSTLQIRVSQSTISP